MTNGEIQPNSNTEMVEVTSKVVGLMQDVGGTFAGAISYTLPSDDKYQAFTELVDKSLVSTVPGGQRACMDGRGLDTSILPGPKTAGGTQGDARRVQLALVAGGIPFTFQDALSTVMLFDNEQGFESGGHESGQCGAVVHANSALKAIADQPDVTSDMVKNLMTAIGNESLYSQESMDLVIDAAKQLANQKADAGRLTDINPKANPVLLGEHHEQEIIIITKPDITLDNNRLIGETDSEQAFAYNLDYHIALSNELAHEYGDHFASLYLHAVVAMDMHTLTKLTDGTPRVRLIS